jgi:cell division protein FtsB
VIDKIKTIVKHPGLAQLKDIRVIELIVFCFIFLLVSWSSVSVIQQNYDLQKQIARLEEKNQIQQLENSNQKLKNEYYNSDQYLELQARSAFGKGAPGERLLLVPKKVALSKTVDLSKAKMAAASDKVADKPIYQKHFEAWMDFFSRRSVEETLR